jgi:hypothetical protein
MDVMCNDMLQSDFYRVATTGRDGGRKGAIGLTTLRNSNVAVCSACCPTEPPPAKETEAKLYDLYPPPLPGPARWLHPICSLSPAR